MTTRCVSSQLGVYFAAAFCLFSAMPAAQSRDLSFDDRVAAQKAIEEVYWSHRTWPQENKTPKPPLSSVTTDAMIRAQVADDLRMSALLESYWGQPITGEQLRDEVERMAQASTAPGILRELYAALHDDPFLIAECLARPALARRRVEAVFAGDERIHGAQRAALTSKLSGVLDLEAFENLDGEHAEVTLALDDSTGREGAAPDPGDRAIRLTRDEWNGELGRMAATFSGLAAAPGAFPVGRVSGLLDQGDRFVAVAVRGKEPTRVTVVSVSWAKRSYESWVREGGAPVALDPKAVAPPAEGYATPMLALATCVDDTWAPTTPVGAPPTRYSQTAVWTGSEMLVWGGYGQFGGFNTGGRYNPATGVWSSIPGSLAVAGRYDHTAVWTGTEMIVWGGWSSVGVARSGGRYNPSTNAWIPSSLNSGSGANVPPGTADHAAIWTGSEMIVWGGFTGGSPYYVNTGGRYNPSTDSWALSSLSSGSGAHVATPRYSHTAVWTGSEMIVWGGLGSEGIVHTGGRYNPTTDSWALSSLNGGSGVYNPSIRYQHTAVWTGSEMIVWGGWGLTGMAPNYYGFLNTGGRFDPVTDSWPASSLLHGIGENVPAARTVHSAVWTGEEMIVWGGQSCDNTDCHYLRTGGRYDPAYDEWAVSSLDGGSNVPSGRQDHSAVWTGSSDRRMIVWGGYPFNAIGGLYCARECVPRDWYQDADGDGHGVPDATQSACRAPAGFAAASDDCDDSNADVHPGAAEICDGLDDDCDAGTPIDGGGDALCEDANPCTAEVCAGEAGCLYTNTTADCDDGNPCTTADFCAGGICDGLPDSGNPCEDADECTLGDTCVTGECLPGPGVRDCNDDNLCTDDSCSPDAGCVHDSTASGDLCDDGSPCTLNACDPVLFCIFPPTPAGFLCDDFDPCTQTDRCDGAGRCSGTSVCDDQIPCTDDFADGSAACACSHLPAFPGTMCSDNDACTTGEVCDGGGTLSSCNGGSPVGCDDNNPCTDDACDSALGCVHTENSGGCEDGNGCTTGDTCYAGVCLGGEPVVCTPPDNCHIAGVCDSGTGVCTNPAKPDGTFCDDAKLCTAGETCQAGTCTPATNGLNHPAPKTSGYYLQLCEKREQGQLPWHGDQLTDEDAVCVAGLTATFNGFATVDDLCTLLLNGQTAVFATGGSVCERGEIELIASAVNICRARVCEEQGLDSTCHGNILTTVSQSFADADGILDDPGRTSNTCLAATCELREINNGHALEMNSLTLLTTVDGTRLTWLSPQLEDGSGNPDYYEVWRRPLRSPATFAKIGTTTELNFLDMTSGVGSWEYEITAVMP